MRVIEKSVSRIEVVQSCMEPMPYLLQIANECERELEMSGCVQIEHKIEPCNNRMYYLVRAWGFETILGKQLEVGWLYEKVPA